jgi:UDP-N-acetylmuramoylalanine--D-glutamate ligase
MINWLKQKIGDKRIIILGFGLEGKSTLNYLVTKGIDNRVLVADKDASLIKHPLLKNRDTKLGKEYLSDLSTNDFIIKSPGIQLENRTNLKSHSQTSLFLDYYGHQTIGVTGTKGKSTTSSMIYKVLSNQGISSLLIGNIGQPAFDLIEKIDSNLKVVYELSAHQLRNIEKGPRMAILLNLMPEHLDFFDSIEDYYQAKNAIFKGWDKNNFVFYHPYIKDKLSNLPPTAKWHTKLQNDTLLIENGKQITDKSLKYLLGVHHIENIQSVVELSFFLKLDINQTIKSIQNFHPLPHRQEYLGNKKGKRFINDSISTIPQSAISAVNAIGEVDYLILGGLDRGIDYSKLVEFLTMRSFKKVFFLGQAGKRILSGFDKYNASIDFDYSWNEKLQDIRNDLLKIKIGTVLLSPAAASYDSFKNFEERGDYFRSVFDEI